MGSNPARPTILQPTLLEIELSVPQPLPLVTQIQKIDSGFVASIDDGSDRKMWLTRSLCEKICQSLASALEKTITGNEDRNSQSSEDVYELLATEHQHAINKISKNKVETVPDSIKSQRSTPVKLCNSVNISFGRVWKLQFFCAEEANSFNIKTDRQNIHQILSAIIKKCSQANWNINNLPVWKED